MGRWPQLLQHRVDAAHRRPATTRGGARRTTPRQLIKVRREDHADPLLHHELGLDPSWRRSQPTRGSSPIGRRHSPDLGILTPEHDQETRTSEALNLPASVFFGYPFSPASRREAITQAATLIAEGGEVKPVAWESLAVTGRLIISTLTDSIEQSSLSAFDVTELNENVLFETGYAIGNRRRLWLLRDRSYTAGNRIWDKFGLLRPIGYFGYVNSDDIRNEFYRTRPHEAATTVFDDLLTSAVRGEETASVLYLASPHETNASRAITRTLERARSKSFRLQTDDPRESIVQPLSWYAGAIDRARAVVAHFTSPNRVDGHTHNARMALLAGLARGMGKRVLMLAEEDYSSPLDYEDALYVYAVPRDAVARVNQWLTAHGAELRGSPTASKGSETTLSVTDIRSFRLGGYVAEDEAELLPDYFVDTRAYREVIGGGVRLFVGRRGSGKTANLIRAADDLAADKRNIVCVIKPAGYELDGLLRLLRSYREKDTKGYLVESLWKYLLFSEIAQAVADSIRERRLMIDPSSPQGKLLAAVEDSSTPVRGRFDARLESAVNDLLPVDVQTGLVVGRLAISEALHETKIDELVGLIAHAVSGHHKLAVLVDNLDKAWEPGTDLVELSQLLLGLLGSMRRVAAELDKRGRNRQPVETSLAVFLRIDIYWYMRRKVAREPDKLLVSYLDWSDRDLLARVIEERYAVARGDDRASIWSDLFCDTVDGMPTREWLLESVLPRPRDLLYICNAALTNAVNRSRERVQGADLVDARQTYSMYAVESILVEGREEVPQLERVLYEFAAAPINLAAEDVLKRVRAGLGKREAFNAPAVVNQLLQLSFLGVQTRQGVSYSENPAELARAVGLAEGRAHAGEEPFYQVHPAFRPYFEIG